MSKPIKSKRVAEHREGNSVRFELYGLEVVEKQVTASGKSGRVYLPVKWLGKRVKIIRLA